jgi:hypothetical protein
LEQNFSKLISFEMNANVQVLQNLRFITMQHVESRRKLENNSNRREKILEKSAIK